MIRITKALCTKSGDDTTPVLLESSCGEWLTNAEWAIRKDAAVCRLALTREDYKPSMTVVLKTAPKAKVIEPMSIVVRGAVPYRRPDGPIVCWVQERYHDAFGHLPAWSAGKDKPVFFGDHRAPVATVMPMRCAEISPGLIDALAEWRP